jgi:predicted GNAT family acetyltransferase
MSGVWMRPLPQNISRVAAFGGALAGVVELVQTPREGNLNVIYTGIARAHRKNGVATALKLSSMCAAQKAGMRLLTTCNHAGNPAILRINESFGFEKKESVLTLSFTVAGD